MTGYVCHVNENIPGAIYIGRNMPGRKIVGGPFGNPFIINVHGNREEVIAEYRSLLTDVIFGDARHTGMTSDEWIEAFVSLRNKPLACWCRKSTASSPACHGDVILELLDTYTDDQLRSFIKEN